MRGSRERRKHVRGLGRRCVDRDHRETVALEEGERVVALVVSEPRAVPELDERNEGVEERLHLRELLLRLVRLDEAGVVLHQDPAQLPGELERFDRRPEGCERLSLVRLLVVRHRRVRLHMEDELVRRSLRPATRDGWIGEVVERRVHLDGVEALPVVAQPSGRGRDAARIPRLDEPFVRKAARSDPYRGGHGARIRGPT